MTRRRRVRQSPITGSLVRCVIAGSALLFGGASLHATEPEASVFVEWSCEPNPCYAMSRFRVDLVVGVEKTFLKERLVQPFQQALDLPLRLDAEWIDAPTGATRVTESSRGDGPTFVVNGEVVRGEWSGERQRDERGFVVARYQALFIAGGAGTLRLPPPTVHFVHASKFRDDLFIGRVPLDRVETEVTGSEAAIDVVSLPSAGKPAGFQGAIGTFSIRSDIAPRRLVVGETARVTIEVSGDGNLDSITLVFPAGGDRWHTLGRLEERDRATRRFLYDLEWISADVSEFPSVVLDYFDPTLGEYRRSIAPAIPVEVELAPSSQPATTASSAAEDRASALQPLISRDEIDRRGREPRSGGWEMLVLLLPWGLAPWLAARVRRREDDREDPDRVRARMALAHFEEVIARENVDVAAAIVSYLAAKLRVQEAAVITPDLAQRLIAHGAIPETAEALASLVDRLSSARYGGESSEGASAEASFLVAELERDWLSRDPA